MSEDLEAKGWEKYGLPDGVGRFDPVGIELAALFLAWSERKAALSDWLSDPVWSERAEAVRARSLKTVSEIGDWLKAFDEEFHNAWGVFGYLNPDGKPTFYDFGFDSAPVLGEFIEEPALDHGDFDPWLTTYAAMSVAERARVVGLLEPMALFDWLTQFRKALNLYSTWFEKAESTIIRPDVGSIGGQIRPLTWLDARNATDWNDPDSSNVFTADVRILCRSDGTEEIYEKANPGRFVVSSSYAQKKGIRIKARFEVVELKDVFSTPASSSEKLYSGYDFEPVFDNLGSGWRVGEIIDVEVEIDPSRTEESGEIVVLDVASKIDLESLPKNYVHRLKPDGSSAYCVFGFGLRVHYYAFDCSKWFEFVDEESEEN